MPEKLKFSHDLTRFEGVYCSGFLIPDPAMVTALALLFDKVHFLNQLEYVIELSKHFKIRHPIFKKAKDKGAEIELTFHVKGKGEKQENVCVDPLANLNAQQKETAHSYLWYANEFCFENYGLFPEVFHCSLLPNNEIFTSNLTKKEGKYPYELTMHSLTLCTGGTDEFKQLLSDGVIPIVGGLALPKSINESNGYSSTQIASSLAINSIALAFPNTKAVNHNEILEARYRLRDHLPPFWSSMLKLTAELSERLAPNCSEKDLQREVDRAVNTIVRPALIDLVNKLEKERKLWFYRILSPIAEGLRVLAGKPPTDLAGFLSSSLTLGANVSLDIAKQLRSVDALKQDSGLTYVIELNNILRK